MLFSKGIHELGDELDPSAQQDDDEDLLELEETNPLDLSELPEDSENNIELFQCSYCEDSFSSKAEMNGVVIFCFLSWSIR